ncbi:MAG: carboxylesterase [Nevskia sp.]|nr:carboxylesterase [Nevskia sp.]
MKITESSEAVQLEPELPATAAVVWLHGLGADGHDFVPLAPALRLPPTVRFVFPHAPVRPVTINGGMRMRAWYDILSLSRADQQDAAGVRASAAIAQGYIEREVSAGIPRSRIVLAGFSQGGAIALHAGLRQAEGLAGILALSTYLPLHTTIFTELTPAGRATPLLMCHGRSDNVLPMALGSSTRDGLRQLGCHVDWHDYPMQHEVCEQEVEDISAWLKARLSQA